MPRFTRSVFIISGAALNEFFINTAATFAGVVEKIKPRSFSSEGLIPTDIPLARKPGTHIFFVFVDITKTPLVD